MKKLFTRPFVIIITALSAIPFLYLLWIFLQGGAVEPRPPKPTGTKEKEFLYQESFYNCSIEISGVWTDANVGFGNNPSYYFVPARKEDLDKYCRVSSVIEYRAVIDILKRDDVSSVISRYPTTRAWIKALSHKYIEDKAFLQRILPAYSHLNIDCIIVVHSPEGTRFFVENAAAHNSHDDHQYIEIRPDEFLQSLYNAPSQDITNFWLGLR